MAAGLSCDFNDLAVGWVLSIVGHESDMKTDDVDTEQSGKVGNFF